MIHDSPHNLLQWGGSNASHPGTSDSSPVGGSQSPVTRTRPPSPRQIAPWHWLLLTLTLALTNSAISADLRWSVVIYGDMRRLDRPPPYNREVEWWSGGQTYVASAARCNDSSSAAAWKRRSITSCWAGGGGRSGRVNEARATPRPDDDRPAEPIDVCWSRSSHGKAGAGGGGGGDAICDEGWTS